MNNHIKTFTNSIATICESVDQFLSENDVNSTLKMPDLMGHLAVQFNWSVKDVRVNDPLVRQYLRSHPSWVITCGAKGGIINRQNFKVKQPKTKIAKNNYPLREEVMSELMSRVSDQPSSFNQKMQELSNPEDQFNQDMEDNDDSFNIELDEHENFLD